MPVINNKWMLLFALVAATGCDAVGEASEEPVTETVVASSLTTDSTLTCTADLATDPYNCGACGSVCASGICNAGVCADDRAAHVFVIGNSYRASNPALDRILGNAAFLPEGKVDILVYRDISTPADVHTGTQAALSRAVTMMKRTVAKTVVKTPASVQQLLPTMDVLLIEAMPTASNGSLSALSDELSLPLDDFMRRGGVVVVLDAPSTVNSGTAKVLGNLINVTQQSRRPGELGYVTDASDIATGRVPLTFALKDSVGYAPTSYADSVTSDSGDVVVVHRSVVY